MQKKKPNWQFTYECSELGVKIEGEMYSKDVEKMVEAMRKEPEKAVIRHTNRDILQALVQAFDNGELQLPGKQTFAELKRFVHRTFRIEMIDREGEYVSESSILSMLYKIRRDL